MKYEVDKITGYLRVDRPQRTSSQPPSLYGFIPRTYCGRRVGELTPDAKYGDGDPLDICVFSERPIAKSEVILNARVIGGLQLLDDEEADDKIVAVLQNDSFWSNVQDMKDMPETVMERLRHYFATYKLVPGQENRIHVKSTFGREHAIQVIEAAIHDYEEEYGS
jgi:inorganic pyrophosphatase